MKLCLVSGEEYAWDVRRLLVTVLFGIFAFVTLFGLPALLSHDDHHVGCPLLMAQEVMCESTILEHFSIWQAMLATIVVLIGFFIATLYPLRHAKDFARERFRLRWTGISSRRPTLMQELYASGILNRKESYALS